MRPFRDAERSRVNLFSDGARNRCHPSLSHFASPRSRVPYAMRDCDETQKSPRAMRCDTYATAGVENERRAWRAALKRAPGTSSRRARTQPPPGTCYTTVTNLVTVRCAQPAIKPLATMTARITSVNYWPVIACQYCQGCGIALCNRVRAFFFLQTVSRAGHSHSYRPSSIRVCYI